MQIQLEQARSKQSKNMHDDIVEEKNKRVKELEQEVLAL